MSFDDLIPAYRGPSIIGQVGSTASVGGSSDSSPDDANMNDLLNLILFLQVGGGWSTVQVVLDDLKNGKITDPTVQSILQQIVNVLCPSGSTDSMTDATIKQALSLYNSTPLSSDLYTWVSNNIQNDLSSPQTFFLYISYMMRSYMAQQSGDTSSWPNNDPQAQQQIDFFIDQPGTPSGREFISEFLAAYAKSEPVLVSWFIRNCAKSGSNQDALVDILNGDGPYSLKGWSPPSGVSVQDAMAAMLQLASAYLPTDSSPIGPPQPMNPDDLAAYEALQDYLQELQKVEDDLQKFNAIQPRKYWPIYEKSDANMSLLKDLKAGLEALKKDWAVIKGYIQDPKNGWSQQFASLGNEEQSLDSAITTVQYALDASTDIFDKASFSCEWDNLKSVQFPYIQSRFNDLSPQIRSFLYVFDLKFNPDS